MFPCITKDKSALNKDIFTVGFCLFVFTVFGREFYIFRFIRGQGNKQHTEVLKIHPLDCTRPSKLCKSLI